MCKRRGRKRPHFIQTYIIQNQLICVRYLFALSHPYQYCRNIRDQILESFNHRDFSLMVVGSKYDLVSETHKHSQVNIT